MQRKKKKKIEQFPEKIMPGFPKAKIAFWSIFGGFTYSIVKF